MEDFIKNLVQKIESTINKVMTLESDRDVNRAQLVVEIGWNHRHYYFGVFDSIDALEKWLSQHDLHHLQYKIIDLHHPQSSREDWPI